MVTEVTIYSRLASLHESCQMLRALLLLYPFSTSISSYLYCGPVLNLPLLTAVFVASALYAEISSTESSQLVLRHWTLATVLTQ